MLSNQLNLGKFETLTTTMSEAFMVIFHNLERTMTFQKI